MICIYSEVECVDGFVYLLIEREVRKKEDISTFHWRLPSFAC